MLNRLLAISFVSVATILGGCATAPDTPEAKAGLHDEVQATQKRFIRADPGLQQFLDRAHGYVVYPDIGKGGVIVGGGYGKGEVYEKGKLVGYADITQGTVGPQVGGASFAELIVFETNEAMNKFKNSDFQLTANANAVALKAGASAAARFTDGVAIFVMPNSGFMAEASVGGQQLKYIPVETVKSTTPPANRDKVD
jgi:lipid-binding SYLF domain-containing protein